MQKTTSCLTVLVLVAGCANEAKISSSTTKNDLNTLQRALCQKAGVSFPGPVQAGMFQCSARPQKWSVWTSPTGSTGSGLIGVYDKSGKLLSWTETDAIAQCEHLKIRGVGDCILVLEKAWGTGLRLRRLKLLDANDLNSVWLSIDVDHWQEGLEGRNVGHKIEHALFLKDIDNDGQEEIFGIEIAKHGVDIDSMLLEPAKLTNRVFAFDHTERRFIARDALSFGFKPLNIASENQKEITDNPGVALLP